MRSNTGTRAIRLLLALSLVAPTFLVPATPTAMAVDPGLMELTEKVVSAEAADNDGFGYSVAISGDTAVVGMPRDDYSTFTDAGRVCVYVRTGGAWALQATLRGDDSDGELFGYSVAIDGDTLVIGGPGYSAGFAYVSTRTGDTWSPPTRLLQDDPGAGDRFGHSVSISGRTVVVGAPYDDDVDPETGSAYVFTESHGVWTQQAKLNPEMVGEGARFGSSVAVLGDTVLVGAPFYAGNGEANIFSRASLRWTEVARIHGDAGTGSEFGSSVALGVDLAVVGTPKDDQLAADAGAAYVFAPTGFLGAWTKRAKLTASDPDPGAFFGSSVAVSADDILVGSYGAVHVPTNSGAAYLFTATGKTSWTQRRKLVPSDAQSGQAFGQSVGLSGTLCAVGSPYDDGSATNQGSTYFGVTNTTPSAAVDSYTLPKNQLSAVAAPGLLANDSDLEGDLLTSSLVTDANSGTLVLSADGSFTYQPEAGFLGDETFSYRAYDGVAYSDPVQVTLTVVNTVPTASDLTRTYHKNEQLLVAAPGVLANASDADGDPLVAELVVPVAHGMLDLSPNGGFTYTPDSGSTSDDAFTFRVFDGVNYSADYTCYLTYENRAPVVVPDTYNVEAGNLLQVPEGRLYSLLANDLDPEGDEFWAGGYSDPAEGTVTSFHTTGEFDYMPPTDYLGTDQFTYRLTDGVTPSEYGGPVTIRVASPVSGRKFAIDGEPGDYFGCVALDGETWVVGASGDDSQAGLDTGSVYVYDNGVLMQKLVAPDPGPGDWFGVSVAVSGTTIAVGAPSDDTADGANAGSAYVFEYSGGAWALQQKLVPTDASEEKRFGGKVSIDGDTIVIGAQWADDLGPNSDSGAAYVFTRAGDAWVEQQKLVPPDLAPGDRLGYAVAISGDTVAVGAPADDDKGTTSGGAYVFIRSGDTWSMQQKLTAADGAANDWFGNALDVDGATLVVGAADNDDWMTDNGSAYVFTRSTSTWSLQQKLLAPDMQANEYFGHEARVDGDAILIGAGSENEKGVRAGAAYLFQRLGTQWRPTRKLVAPDGAPYDYFGEHGQADISGTTAVVGALNHDVPAEDAGSIYYFDTTYGEVEDQAAGVTFDRFVTGFSGSYTGGTYVYGRWTNTELQAKFTGTKVRWMGPKQPSYGMADVYIDGTKVASNVDCYEPSGSATLSATLWESAALSDGPHTIKIRLTGAKNAASSGNVVVIDRFEVEGAAPSGTGTRFNELGGWATFTGTWVKAVNPTYTSSTYAYAAWANTTYTASFTGTKVAWIGPKSQPYGKAAVYIDGGYKGTIDCYSASTGWRYKIWESGTLSSGPHYIQIKPLHTKSAAATNYVVVVDALDVTP